MRIKQKKPDTAIPSGIQNSGLHVPGEEAVYKKASSKVFPKGTDFNLKQCVGESSGLGSFRKQ